MQGGNCILDSLCHCINLCLLGNVLATGNGIDGGFHSGKVLVVVLVQCICFGNGCINLGVVGVLVLQGSNGIFDSLCHGIYFALLGNVLTTGNGIDGGFHSGEILVVILLQSICLGEGCINLGVVGILVLQGSNGIFDSLCHGIYFALLGNVLTTGNGIDGGFHSGEILVVILLQSICLGEGCIDLGVVGVLVLQGGKGSFDSLFHGIHFALLGNVFTTDNGIDSRFYCGEVFVIILLQSICLGDGFVNLCVISILVLQGSNGIFNSLRHCIHLRLLCQCLPLNHRIDCTLHGRKILVIIFNQGICLGNGRIYAAIVGRAIDFRIVANLCKCFSQQSCHRAVSKFFFCLFTGRTSVLSCSTSPKETVCNNDTTIAPQVTCENASGLDSGHSGSLGRKHCPIYMAIFNS